MNTDITSPETDFDTALRHAQRCSRYVRRLLDSDSELQSWLQTSYALPYSEAEIASCLTLKEIISEDMLASKLRKLRQRVLLKLLTRDLAGLANLDEVMRCMTTLAELSLQHAQSFVMHSLTEQYGQPIGEISGLPQEMLVIGMGKLGGRELNVSSDIDLIFVYPEEGACNGSHNISNHEFFSKLGRRLIGILNELTEDGFVFRVDMRLRPHGDSGPLVMSFVALEEYLVAQGREWERYAWIKARVVSPLSDPNIQELMQLVQPFIYRKYLDFGAFESMRKLHVQLRQEVRRRDRLDNIKLGPGGIREIEFIAQVFQLIRGGNDAGLCIRPTLQVLQYLSKTKVLPSETVSGLSGAYVFLRNLEHRLQYLDDQQTQELPINEEDRSLIAAGMNLPDYNSLLERLNVHRTLVSEQFAQIFSTPDNSAPESEATECALWHDNINHEELTTRLKELRYENFEDLAKQLLLIRNSGRYRQLPESSRQRLDKLIPQFIILCASANNHDQALLRILNLLESISRRASYLAFLAEYPQVLERLVKIANASAWASDYLIQHPVLLDELLDAREIYRAPDWPALNDALQKQLADADIERQMDGLRQFQHSQVFHLLAMDLQDLLPLETLSDHLSNLADLVLRHVLHLCWQDARMKHQPRAQFAIIAYGKLGGRELGYAADLDLIFLYQDTHPDAAEIYAKLAQRINTLLSSYTSAGRLYETDLRLRPNGASGLLVSSIDAFKEYQLQHAWVWEHQALTRARFCTGDENVGGEFETIRGDVLCMPRDLSKLRREIAAMRQKMHDGHPNDSGLFDIKHDSGGMVDIEFMVQFLVLAYSHQHPELTANSGNLALLKQAGKLGLIEVPAANAVSRCYRSLRAVQHKIRMNNVGPCRINVAQIDTKPVKTLWLILLGNDL